MDLQIGNPNAIFLILIPLGLLGLGLADQFLRKRKIRRFGAAEMLANSIWRRRFTWLNQSLIFVSLVLLAVSLMDIRWGKSSRDVPQRGIEVMFVLDVSRSMLAEDVSPNRLSRAKQQIKDMLEVMDGDRVGLVVFGGEAKQEVPLTNHFDDFRKTLDEVSPDSVNIGGSKLGDALECAAKGFLNKTNGYRTIVVFTDGEDQESKPVDVSKRLANDLNARIFTVGLGDLKQGAKIPQTRDQGGGYVQYEGQTVVSKLDGATLQAVANATGGAYIPAGTKQVDMADVYFGYIANVEKTEFESATITTYTPRYHWFAVPAIVALLLEIWISTLPASPHSRKQLSQS